MADVDTGRVIDHPAVQAWADSLDRSTAAFATLMELQLTGKALSHLARLYDFLAPENRLAAARTVQALTAAPGTLLAIPRMVKSWKRSNHAMYGGLSLDTIEMHYAIQESTI
ncbi:type II toxin-antitoxin system RelE/ParE family toxin [Sulfuriferula sp.]|uniref:type II toxin-antitoxin system RelE/ParE family toxin n=1 Tax=Sulfuriferula sp. TaxID=2025307 RepID=UPI00272FC72F|nr:type II toxin-antitoxin system RelE/ParE family toxin [Sulfuriferula sp.]MDP2025636.1 type II toxin-antitoxin system RelE/ParE family toxin [Sulfuriferula sp.]